MKTNNQFKSTFKNSQKSSIFLGGCATTKRALAGMIASDNNKPIKFFEGLAVNVADVATCVSQPPSNKLTLDFYLESVKERVEKDEILIDVFAEDVYLDFNDAEHGSLKLKEVVDDVSGANKCIAIFTGGVKDIHAFKENIDCSFSQVFEVKDIGPHLYHQHNLEHIVNSTQQVAALTLVDGDDKSLMGRTLYLVISNGVVDHIHSALLNGALSLTNETCYHINNDFVVYSEDNIYHYPIDDVTACFKYVDCDHQALNNDCKMTFSGCHYRTRVPLTIDDHMSVAEVLINSMYV